MKKKLGRKIMALVLALTMALSLIPMSAISASAGVSLASFDKWVTNQFYSRCLSAAGNIIQEIGNTTSDEGTKEFLSFINTALCGGSDTGELKATCNEILDTTKRVESVALDINSRIANDKITTNSSYCDNAWESQVMDYFTKNDESPYDFYNVYVAYRDYLNYAGNPSSIPNGYSIEYYEDNFISELTSYYKGYKGKINDSFTTEKEMYTTETMDVCLTGIIKSILNTMDPNTTSVGIGKRFIDLSAQYAYYAYPYSDKQAEFIDYATQYQVNTVTYLLMIYQDFLAHRAEYFENSKNAENAEIYNDIWESCYKNYYESTLVKFTTSIENFLNGDIYLKEIDAHTTLDQYVRGDSVSVSYDTQKNSSVLTANTKPVQSLKYGDKTSNSTFTKNGTLSFYKSAYVKVKNGKLKFTPFYVLNGEALDRNYLNLKYFDVMVTTAQLGINGMGGNFYYSHYLTPDYYNLKDITFTDGINTYAPISNPNQLKDIINETYFTANGSTPYSYFAPFMGYSKGKTNYLLLSGDTQQNIGVGSWSTKYTEIPVFNMSSSTAFSANWSSKFLNAGSFSDSTYSLILVSQNDVIKSKVDTKLVGEGKITVSDKTEITAEAGKKVNVKITAPENYAISKITATYHNGNKQVDKVISTGMDANEFTFEYPVPYSNVTITVITEPVLNKNEDGKFIVRTYDDLCVMAKMVNRGNEKYTKGSYVLVNDIDCPKDSTWTTSIGQTALYNSADPKADGDWGFAGTFEGNGHIIKNLSVKGSSEKEASFGLFGTVSGTVKNLGIENFTYTGNGRDSRVGAVAGQILNGGKIVNCYLVNGNINTQILTKDGVAGGIAGANYSGTIENCYVYNLTVSAGRAGGIAGDNYGDGNNANGTDRPGTIKNCYTTTDSICKRGTATESISGVSADRYASGEIAYLLNNGVTNGTQTWYQNIDNDLTPDSSPVLVKNDNNTVYKVDRIDRNYSNFNKNELDKDEDGSYIIKTYDDLCTMAKMVNSGKNEYAKGSYFLANDIDCKGQNWTTAIGTDKLQFNGTFDGQGYTISNLNLDGKDADYIGLFAYNNGTIKDLKLSNCNVSGRYYVGGICGYNTGTIENISFDGEIYGEASVGGICGSSSKGNITHCSNTATVSSGSETAGYNIGGICGYSDGNITYCSNTGAVSSKDNSVGGICGYSSKGNITHCSNTGTVSSEGVAIGGICGDSSGNITGCYNNTNVSGADYVGGICGYFHGLEISTSYNTGNVEGTTQFGPICGVNKTGGKIDKCYYWGSSETDSNDGTEFKTAEQFASGEVASLLNNGVTDGTQAWYQNIDNGLAPDSFPVLVNNDNNTVYKVDRSDRTYSNFNEMN